MDYINNFDYIITLKHWFQLELTAGVVVEVQLSSVGSTGLELWMQQPLHPTYAALHRLRHCMNTNYSDGSNSPTLPEPVERQLNETLQGIWNPY